MDIIIQKFGGTSVATKQARAQVIKKISAAIAAGFSPIVVVSAIGRIGAPYATDTLLEFIKANAGEMNAYETDVLLSCGELISAVTISTILNNQGIAAKTFTGGQAGIITDDHHTAASLLYTTPIKIITALNKGIVPVVAGFQGVTTNDDITTLGRGGSDTSASILGASVNASRIEIYTDVDGIMTADPKICDHVSKIEQLSYNEVFQMSDSGARVIHSKAVEYAMLANIPLIIKNTFSDDEGSIITQKARVENQVHKTVTAIAHKTGRVQYRLLKPPVALLTKIATKNISIDLINILPDTIIFTISDFDQHALEKLLAAENCDFTKIEGCAKVTAIGERITGVPGIMARIANTLEHVNIPILQTADSLTTIACLVREYELKTAVIALHQEFDL